MISQKEEKQKIEIVLASVEPKKVHGMGIGKIATNFSFTFLDTEIVKLADELEKNPEIQAVGVVDRQGKTKGLITRKELFGMLSRPFGRDVLRRKSTESFFEEVKQFNLNDNIFTVSEEIEAEINSNALSYYLLVNDHNEFRGIFSGKDMLVFLAEITRQDIALSRKIQTRIVKEEEEYSSKNFTCCASSIMAKGIGGDFYSIKKISDSLHLIVLCDVSGKGMAASLLSSLLSGFINTYPIGTDLMGLVRELNSQLTRSFAGENFITGLFIIFNEETGVLQIADMGHTHYLKYSDGKRQKVPKTKVNIPLGVSDEMDVKVFTIYLNHKDSFFMMTDGLIEQKNNSGLHYDYENLNNVLKHHNKLTTKGLKTKLLKSFNYFKGNAARQDDISFIILNFHPAHNSEKSNSLSHSNNSIEEKIKWALSTGKPIQVKTNRYLTEDREFIDTILDRFFNEAGIKFLMNKVSYCVHELATNAKKANTKRVYFKQKKLDIENMDHYVLGMKEFKTETIDNIKYYLDEQKKQGYFIVIMLQLTEKSLKISVVNNSEMTQTEKQKVQHKLKIAESSASIGEIYDEIEDYSEGAGLGIVMMSHMLRTIGFGPDVLTIKSEEGLTNSTISLELRT